MVLRPHLAAVADSRRNLGMEGVSTPFGDQQIGQRKQCVQLRGVLGQAPIAYLLQAKYVLM